MASGGIASYQNVNVDNPIDATSGYYNYETPNILAPSVTASNLDMLIFFDGVTINTSVNPPTGMTERWDIGTGDSSTGTTSEMSDMLLSSAGPTGDKFGTHNGTTNSNISQLVALKPAPLTVSPAPTPTVKPGDANNDGRVDESDYSTWITYYKQTVAGGAGVGDFNNDGRVDGIDYVIWLNNYGK
jgi:hypothetical protein